MGSTRVLLLLLFLTTVSLFGQFPSGGGTSSGGAAPPTGAAGGVLSGNYPNPALGGATASDIGASLTCSDSGGDDDYSCNFSPAPVSLASMAGVLVQVKVAAANAGAATFAPNGFTAKAIKKQQGAVDLETGDVAANSYMSLAYNASLDVWDMKSLSAQPPVTVAANGVIAGCGVEYVSGLTFEVGACSFLLQGGTYSSPFTSVTLTVADPTNPRIDVIGADITGAVFVIAGTPAASPVQPTVDASIQLQLTFVAVGAGATTPTGVAVVDVYQENAEWTSSTTANINAASTTNPYRGTADVNATAAVLGNNVQLVKPAAGTEDLANYNTLVFYIRSKGTWPTGGGGGGAARALSIFWQNGSTPRGLQVTLRSGVFGFDSSNTAAYQQISIPTSLFNANGLPVTTLRIQVSGSSGSSSIGFYIDAVTLQGGVSSFVLPTTLTNFKGTWNAGKAYNVNDIVVSGGDGYIALLASTNVAVTTTTTWASLTPVASRHRAIQATFGECGGSALTTGKLAYAPDLLYACTISRWAVSADAGTATVKVWRIASGTALPTSANVINTSGLSLSFGTVVQSTNVGDFTDTTLDAHDILAITLTAVATATCVQAIVECDI